MEDQDPGLLRLQSTSPSSLFLHNPCSRARSQEPTAAIPSGDFLSDAAIRCCVGRVVLGPMMNYEVCLVRSGRPSCRVTSHPPQPLQASNMPCNVPALPRFTVGCPDFRCCILERWCRTAARKSWLSLHLDLPVHSILPWKLQIGRCPLHSWATVPVNKMNTSDTEGH